MTASADTGLSTGSCAVPACRCPSYLAPAPQGALFA